MSGPGQYWPDPTEGLSRAQALPEGKRVRRSRNFTRRPCPRCDPPCFRHAVFTRVLPEVGDLVAGRPRQTHLPDSQHYCPRCAQCFNVDTSDYALPQAHYPHRVVALAVRLVVEAGLPYQAARWPLWRAPGVFVPFAAIQNWVAAGGEKGGPASGG